MATVPAEEVCAHVLAGHARLRELSARLAETALQTARKIGHGVVRASLIELRSEVEQHVSLEEELVPLLEEANAWGPVRVEQLRERHRHVLQVLDGFAEELAEGRHEPCDLVGRLEEVTSLLFGDMQDEKAAIDAQTSGSVVVGDQTSG